MAAIVPQTILQQTTYCSMSTLSTRLSPTSMNSMVSYAVIPSSSVSRKFTLACCQPMLPLVIVDNGNAVDSWPPPQRNSIRLGLPSKGRLNGDTLDLLKDCQLDVKQRCPRRYQASIPQLPNVEVWFQHCGDMMLKLLAGDLELAIAGFDIVSEYDEDNKDLIIVHDALGYGECRLSLAVPKGGIFENINSVKELAEMPQWTAERPLRVATKFIYHATKLMKNNGLTNIAFSTAEGTLEAEPAMGCADVILDIVGSGETLDANDLKEIKDGIVLQSQAVLVASRKSLSRKGVLDTTREILERLEARKSRERQQLVIANIRGSSAEEVAERVLSQSSLSGLQGPTVSPVFLKGGGKPSPDYFAVKMCTGKSSI